MKIKKKKENKKLNKTIITSETQGKPEDQKHHIIFELKKKLKELEKTLEEKNQDLKRTKQSIKFTKTQGISETENQNFLMRIFD